MCRVQAESSEWQYICGLNRLTLPQAVCESADPQYSLSEAPDIQDQKTPGVWPHVGFLGVTSVFNPGGMSSWKTGQLVNWIAAIWVT